jgi:hypothetical protein
VSILLNSVEARVLGALVEKDITTPDYYPLSLNALVNACNQKNNRDPVMTLDEATVREALDGLHNKNLAGPASSADSRVTKYEHRLQEMFNFTRGETAMLCAVRRPPASSALAANVCSASKISAKCSHPCSVSSGEILRWQECLHDNPAPKNLATCTCSAAIRKIPAWQMAMWRGRPRPRIPSPMPPFHPPMATA